MPLADIHFHDAELLRAVEESSAQELRFEVMYPINWQQEQYAKRTIVFSEVLEYQVHEGPIHGNPTLLGYTVVAQNGLRTRVRIETNAGYRELEFRDVSLADASET